MALSEYTRVSLHTGESTLNLAREAVKSSRKYLITHGVRLMQLSDQQVLDELVGQFCPEPPRLRPEDPFEQSVEGPLLEGGTRPGSRVTLFATFLGDPQLVRYRTKESESGKELLWEAIPGQNTLKCEFFVYAHGSTEETSRDEAKIKSSEVRLRTHFKRLEADLSEHRRDMEDREFPPLVTEWRNSVAATVRVESMLQYPIRRYEDLPEALVPPKTRKEISPSAEAGEGKVLRWLRIEDFEGIIRVLDSMCLTMERSPHTFHRLQEPQIRDFFLVVLNSHFHGSATGETFNLGGKPDIVIRENNENLFLAECKVWRGRKLFEEAMIQLMGYVTWRDRRLAILVFNKEEGGTSFGTVLDVMGDALAADPIPGYHMELRSHESESKWFVRLTKPGDPKWRADLAVVAYNIPRSSPLSGLRLGKKKEV